MARRAKKKKVPGRRSKKNNFNSWFFHLPSRARENGGKPFPVGVCKARSSTFSGEEVFPGGLQQEENVTLKVFWVWWNYNISTRFPCLVLAFLLFSVEGNVGDPNGMIVAEREWDCDIRLNWLGKCGGISSFGVVILKEMTTSIDLVDIG